MNRGSSVLVGLALAFYLSLFALDIVLTSGNGSGAGTTLPAAVAFDIVMMTFAATGLILCLRLPRNPIGWIFVWVSSGGLGGTVLEQWGLWLHRTGARGVGGASVWLGQLIFACAITSLFFILLLFPNGALPSRRWRAAALLIGGVIVSTTILGALTPGELPGTSIPNPLGIRRAGSLSDILGPVLEMLWLPTLILPLACPVLRYRRARGIVRQQLKWFAYATAFMIVAAFPVNALLRATDPALNDIGFMVGLAALPIAVAIAILRYRLYEIDVIIRRTLLYASLSSVLGVAYLVLVFAIQAVLRPLAGDSELAVAASTLTVAAMVGPVRTRLQTFLDRRFYRARYDAALALGRFSSSLREEIDMTSIREQISDLVGRTLRPSHASLWLRGSR